MREKMNLKKHIEKDAIEEKSKSAMMHQFP